ncbi:glucose 1-dehydrogenase [Planotetraspora sp. A-T 1434]|uniref:SDR family NAD(P)-dependent oxidoreductase n=1 Tax=Planotetraspora sp. A-T 1434 TaxID=2979219 RepID=UPI0021C1EFCE|nr:glucose 1-dehydrogenase [Planotetraspora sp. A-T 1434]MCT9931463.1 glucose 1-dehydrogenase [Planotetraspora sp. A-T 1434]
MTGRMAGRVALITGAGSGIGRAIAAGLAREGARVGVLDLRAAAADSTVAEINASGGAAAAFTGDVSVRSDVRRAISGVVGAFGRLDVQFNNAGFNKPMRLLDITEENWRAIMDVNALGTLIGMQEAAKQMIAQGGGGKIINTASVAGRQGYPDWAPYCASKFAVIALTQAGARGLAKQDITVNAFAPGVVDTPLWTQLNKDLMDMGASEWPGQVMEDLSANSLLGRPARPEDIVGTALYLASSDSDYLTGQVVMIDGGLVIV